MENRNVGFIILGISVIIIAIILLFNATLKEIVGASCGMEHALTCPMNTAITKQTYLALFIVGILITIGVVLIFTKQKEKIVLKKVKVKKKKLNFDGLDKDEKRVVDILMKEGRAVFQSALMESMNIGKVKTTRLLDKLEAKQIIERKRRGMNNIIVLKD